MRLTLAWLSVCLAIYCGGGHSHSHSHGHGHGNVVLSLPPSLIAMATEAAALRLQQQHQQQQPRWKKDARVLFDSGNDALRDMLQRQAAASAAGKFSLPHYDHDHDHDNAAQLDGDGDADVEQQPQAADFNRKVLREVDDLGAQTRLRQQSAAQEIAPLQRGMLGLNYASTPHRYWASRCQGRLGPSAKCPQEYYRAMMAARNKDAMARLHMQLSSMQDPDSSASDNSNDDDDQLLDPTDDEEEKSSNEVFMLLTGEQDLIKFLHWAMKLLYPFERPEGNRSDSPAEHYHPGMFLWKKLNLSGHLEPPLIVDEPQFVLVRREKLLDGYHLGDETTKEDDPFIPPRGRKHNNPDLDALFNRYETFVPNRGRRDKVKDLFKYDDLFFPNRGKKYRSIFKLDDPFFPNRGKKLQLRDLYKIDDPFFPNRGKRHLTGSTKTPPPSGLWGKLLQQQQQQERKLPDDSDNWPQRMSTHKINGYDQSVKPSMSQVEDAAILASRARARATPTPTATATAAEGAQWRGLARGLLQPANRLHSTRSMSANLQQPELGMEMEQLVPHLPLQQQSSVHFIGNPIMPRQQVKPSWLGSGSGSASGSLHRFRRSLRPDNAPETQLTRSTNANPQKIDSGSDSDAEWDWDTDDANWSDI
ncbi:uncharacterized protein LOC6588522 [Drosophila persimilis]|uniref:uncharacterized protein LOC6588522 n=1 Tax=Drosophila persimilis TaxID=7234 RepID=UPI000F095FD9|nr:uncharacterized protein LOC6588522 [Drosophila persimilis]